MKDTFEHCSTCTHLLLVYIHNATLFCKLPSFMNSVISFIGVMDV